MGREEQVEEREVLDSIFPDEIKDIDETSFVVTINLDTFEEDGPPPTMLLKVRYPDTYPDAAPDLSLSSPSDVQPHPHFNLAEDKKELLEGLETTIEENMGMAMVFSLVSALKEEAEALAQSRKDAALRVHEEQLLEAERQENEKFHGQQVTRESFLKWREGFLMEMEEKRTKEEEGKAAEMKKKNIKEPTKLTGRQLWERGLAKGEVGDDDDAATEGVENLKVSA
ncbi:hypothetical protein MKZ38_005387 [Zalerion maritima]|uniref:RWD domain-containing protein n=1 Tax=Zalerion maritima TaxID=339359 RepID=A0AAD5RKD1_9PEZI|nr:hypothetical protein MKZ38_005387 [Zalerion maritima]